MSKKRIKIVVSIVAVVVAVAVLVGVLAWYFSRGPPSISSDNMHMTLDPQAGTLTIRRPINNDVVLQSTLVGLNKSKSYRNCEATDSNICIEWESGDRVEITSPHLTPGCYDVSWTMTKYGNDTVENCFSLKHAHWFGGAQVFNQQWPIEKWNRKSSAFVAGDSYQGQYGGVLERYFLSSKGVALLVNKDVPLFVSINDSGNTNLCFVGKWAKPYTRPFKGYPIPTLSYKVCVRADARKMHDFVANSILPKPSDIPDKRMIREPIWSTWAQYKKTINQSTVMEFANAILANNFTHSQLEIDDDWTPKYGDWNFNVAKFPNASIMIRDLKQMGFRVTVWVHPFMNIDSSSFFEAAYLRHLMTDPGGQLPALTSWWDGDATGILDVTNPSATNWFKQKLNFLKSEYGVDSFKFDGGETNWLPAATLPNVSFISPEDYTRKWSQLSFEADTDVRIQEVRVGAPGSQHLPIFVRMMDKDSVWGYNNGLKTVIPDALTFGLLGFPFVLPDMIGGNAYNGSLEGQAYPERELYIRWMQVNAFLPSWQFSIVPWQYDNEVIQIAQDVLKLRSQHVAEMISLAEQATRTGAPIVRPLWWISPTDEEALVCDSQFLLGDDVLVAPVLDKGARERDIYLPVGSWKDMLTNQTKEGPTWLRNYAVKLNQLAYFVRQA